MPLRGDVLTVALAGLFHDFGKIDRLEKHPLNSSQSLKNLRSKLSRDFSARLDDVCKLIEHHHDQQPPRDIPLHMFYALKFGDWLASNYREKEEVHAKGSKRIRIFSPFPSVSEDICGEWAFSGRAVRERRVLEGLIEKRLSTDQTPETQLVAILTRLYLDAFAIPDAVKDATIPLPVHLHLVSAIASALVASDDFTRAFKSILPEDTRDAARLLSQHTTPMLAVVGMDIHKIQEYIFSFEHESGAMRTLAGRSMLLNILSHTLPLIVADLYGVPPTNVLINSGGRAFILVPARQDIDIQELSYSITRSLWSAGIPVVVDLQIEEISTPELFCQLSAGKNGTAAETLQNAIRSANEKLQASTVQHWIRARLINEDMKLHFASPEQRCTRCGRGLDERLSIEVSGVTEESSGNDVCVACFAAEVIRDNLLRDTPKRPEINLSIPVTTINTEYRIRIAVDSNSPYVEIVRGSDSFVRLSVGEESYIPRPASYWAKGGSMLTLENFGPVFAVVKGDGDSMGIVFGNALKQSLPRYLSLSYAISLFFERIVPGLMKSGNEPVHLVYAGGDDFLVVGSPQGVISAAVTILSSFQSYMETGAAGRRLAGISTFSCLPSVSIGFKVFPQHYKILWAIEDVENLLDLAKSSEHPHRSNSLVKGRIAVQSSGFIGGVEQLPGWFGVAKDVLSEIEGPVARQRFYKILDYSERLVRIVQSHGFSKDAVDTYSSLRHYLNRISSGNSAPSGSSKPVHLEQVAKDILGAALSGPVHNDVLMPLVLAYLFMKSGGGED